MCDLIIVELNKNNPVTGIVFVLNVRIKRLILIGQSINTSPYQYALKIFGASPFVIYVCFWDFYQNGHNSPLSIQRRQMSLIGFL